MTNLKNQRESSNIDSEIIVYLKANISMMEDLVKQMIHQNNETKNHLEKIENVLEYLPNVKNSFKKVQEEIKALNNNVTSFLSNNNSLTFEEDKYNFNGKIDRLIKVLENTVSLKKEIPSTKEDLSTLIFQQILQLQHQQHQQFVNLQQQILQQQNLTATFKELVDSSSLKFCPQHYHECQCNCIRNKKIFQTLSNNMLETKKQPSSRFTENRHNNYSFFDLLIFQITCLILGLVFYIILMDL